ncbi:MAG: cupin domain-containing protein [Bacteroidota bacterium]
MNISHLPSREIMPGYHGQVIHTEHMSLVFWEVEKNAEVPDHNHRHEQVMQVLEGRFQFTLNGHSQVYGPGELVVIPPNAPHSGKALTPCKLVDIFSPPREDFKKV